MPVPFTQTDVYVVSELSVLVRRPHASLIRCRRCGATDRWMPIPVAEGRSVLVNMIPLLLYGGSTRDNMQYSCKEEKR